MINRFIISSLLLCGSITSAQAESIWQCSYEHIVTKSSGYTTTTKVTSGLAPGNDLYLCPPLPKDVFKNIDIEKFIVHLNQNDEPDDISCTHKDLPPRQLDLR